MVLNIYLFIIFQYLFFYFVKSRGSREYYSYMFLQKEKNYSWK